MSKPVVVITGASRGIGRSIAIKFASNGFDLFIGGTNPNTLIELQRELEHDFQCKCSFFAADLSIENQCQLFAGAILKEHSKIDVLVNNAGVFLGGKMMEEDTSQLRKMMDTNLFSAYWVTKGLWNSFTENARSHVLNMCSIASFTAYAAGGSYSISKFALLGFSKSLRLEGLDKGIRVTAIMPGATLTDSWAGVDLPESWFMKPMEVADALFVAWSINQTTVMEEVILRPILGDI
jgi:hypothetical protein